MPNEKYSGTVTDLLVHLRQTRVFTDQPIAPEIVDALLKVARWSGSSKNSQPWHFVVVDDPEMLKKLSEAGAFTQFFAGAKLAIVLLMDGGSPRSNAYDEGRVSERLMLAAEAYGIGSGTGWFSTPDAQQRVRELLGIPDEWDVWSSVAFGYPDTSASHRASSAARGRKPMDEIVSYGRFGKKMEQ
ncbi:MAG TPA: nitroreductase family protein [Thermomicrobiales bacterium]|nr:nitroreductase family protein [Thermomicrobiales bacterium]